MSDYHVSRNGTKLGVYPEQETRDYFAQGRIGPNDLVWREGMAAWLPAGQVFGPVAAPSFPDAPPQPPASPPFMAAVAPTPRAAAPLVAPPPKLHWALVLLLTVVTMGIFFIVWMFIQSSWVRKIDPRSNATTLLAVYVILVLIGQIVIEASGEGSAGAGAGVLLVLAGSVVSIFGFFSMRRSMLDYFNQTDPAGLKLSGVLTFFFNVLYLQYHMTRIARWKQTGILPL